MTEAAAYVARRLWSAAGILVWPGGRTDRPSPAPALERDSGRVAGEAATARSRDGAVTVLGLAIVLIAALLSRLRYIASYDGTFGSGDAHGILLRALYFRNGNFYPSPELVPTSQLFDQPPLLPAALALVARIPGVSLEATPMIFMPLLTMAALAVLYRMLARTLGVPLAVAATLMIAVLPRWSFDSTEPDKGPAVISLVIFAIAAIEAGSRDRRFTVAGGVFMALAMLVHTTAYLFLPVVAGTYIVVHAGALKSRLDKYAWSALALIAASVVLYFSLARVFAPTPLAGSTSNAGGVLPGFVQTYVDALQSLARAGFGDGAWGIYIRGIRAQLGTPVFGLALGGAGIALYDIIVERRRAAAPYLLWASVVTLAFAMQYPASSHGSRYPSYVTPAYIVLACYCAIRLGGLLTIWRGPLARFTAMCALASVAVYATATYATAADPGLRDLYASHAKAAQFITSQRLLDEHDGMLYMGWPSITLNLLDARPDYEDRLYSFGFGGRSLDELGANFVRRHGIKYYLFDHTGRDQEQSADTVFNQLNQAFLMREIAVFTGRPGSYTTLYELRERAQPSAVQIEAFVNGGLGAANAQTPLINASLCPGDEGAFDGWSENGVVALTPIVRPDGTCALFVENHKQWGGVEQIVRGDFTGQPFTVVALVEPGDAKPAQTAIVEMYAGSRVINRTIAALTPGRTNYLVMEGFGPPVRQRLRLVVATGAGDEGDILIKGIVMGRDLVGADFTASSEVAP